MGRLTTNSQGLAQKEHFFTLVDTLRKIEDGLRMG